VSERLLWTGLVLASGRSRRFGGIDKARLPLGGRTLLQRALDALAPIVSTSLVVGPARYPGTVHVPDPSPDGGPVGGLMAGLRAATTPGALVVACDLPFLTPAFLAAVRDRCGSAGLGVVEGADGRVALCVAARRDVLPALERAWREGGRRLMDVVRAVPHVRLPAAVVAEHDPDGRLLLNVNDPLTYARALAEARHDCGASYFTDLDESKRTP